MNIFSQFDCFTSIDNITKNNTLNCKQFIMSRDSLQSNGFYNLMVTSIAFCCLRMGETLLYAIKPITFEVELVLEWSLRLKKRCVGLPQGRWSRICARRLGEAGCEKLRIKPSSVLLERHLLSSGLRQADDECKTFIKKSLANRKVLPSKREICKK